MSLALNELKRRVFSAHYAGISNNCDRKGAERIKSSIEAYWAERGFDVHCTLEEQRFLASIRHVRFDVRSDIGPFGFPTKRLPPL